MKEEINIRESDKKEKRTRRARREIKDNKDINSRGNNNEDKRKRIEITDEEKHMRGREEQEDRNR